jgi:RNA-directed DNA polymerase
VQWPKPALRRLQQRGARLLSRIETPDFLHSAVRGRSYITNARAHAATYPSVKVDIKKFFQSVRAAAVFHFFKDKMQCAPDVSAILTKLFTIDGHLATGGNVSPILSYFAYMDMFSEIEALAKHFDCIVTCLMDDMTFTGPRASPNLIYQVRKIIGRNRLQAHKTKKFRASQPRVITGVAITKVGIRVPNKRQAVIADDIRSLNSTISNTARLNMLPQIIGRAYEAAQIDPRWRNRAEGLVTHRKEIKLRSLQLPSTSEPSVGSEVMVSAGGSESGETSQG